MRGVWKRWDVTFHFDFFLSLIDCANLRQIAFIFMVNNHELANDNILQCCDGLQSWLHAFVVAP